MSICLYRNLMYVPIYFYLFLFAYIYLVYLHSSCPIECHLTESNLISCKSNPISFSRSSIPGLAEDDFRNGKSTTWGNTIVFWGVPQANWNRRTFSVWTIESICGKWNQSISQSIDQSIPSKLILNPIQKQSIQSIFLSITYRCHDSWIYVQLGTVFVADPPLLVDSFATTTLRTMAEAPDAEFLTQLVPWRQAECMMRRKFLVSYWIHGPTLRNLTVHSGCSWTGTVQA